MIRGSRTVLRPARHDDLDMLLKWSNDAETTRWLLIDPPMTRAAESAWLDYMLSSTTDRLFVICMTEGTADLRAAGTPSGTPAQTPAGSQDGVADGAPDNTLDSAPIGTITLSQISRKHRKARVGIAIFEEASRNRGFGTEAMELLLDYSFTTLGLHRVELDVFEDNERAIRSYKKCGFVSEGMVRECYLKNGNFISAILMSILEDEWKNVRGMRPENTIKPGETPEFGQTSNS